MVRPTSTVKPILPSHALGKLPAQRAPRTSHPPRKKASLMIFERTRASPLVSKEETPVNAIEDVAGQPRTNFGPFWVDKEHRQPTLSLYRSLLRVTGKRRLGEVSEGSGSSSQGVAQATSLLGIRGEIQKEWRRYRNLTSIPLTHSVLRKQVHLLSQISPSSSTSTTRLLELDQALLEKQQHRVARAEEIANRPRLRPRMQGGFLRPTINNVPLPRLRPQPPEIHGMISHRIKERERRISRRKSMVEMRGDMLREVDFWRKLGTFLFSDLVELMRDSCEREVKLPAPQSPSKEQNDMAVCQRRQQRSRVCIQSCSLSTS